ncbi:MAG: hypothetical protein K2I80_11405 [Ruminococcus sp.]|nr:hypothetical protein [Ruminococcus sp.]MDE6848671.1 hypothetical protein [Ruminococcus sp.]
MKKFLAVTAAVLSCCLFTACSDNDKQESISSEIPEGEAGEVITPDEDDDEYGLGEYRYSSDGTKLYYDENEYSTELILTLEKYFKSFEENNYEDYKFCLYPSYIDEMNSYLNENYEYDLETSFQNQRESLSEKMGGDFKITRIRAEKAESDSVESYFKPLNETFAKDYYNEIKDSAENFHHLKFYVMAEDSEKTESLLVSGFEIVFAEKDGSYYTFG